MNRTCRILLVGGSGQRANATIIPAILEMQGEGMKARISGICDRLNPYDRPAYVNLQEALEQHQPKWIPAVGQAAADHEALDRFLAENPVDFVIISSGPTSHLGYLRWALNHGLSCACDKPPHVVPCAASDPGAAAQILSDYDELLRLYARQRRTFPDLRVQVTLGRRGWLPVQHAFELCRSARTQFDQGISHLHLILNNGIHRFPREWADDSAHGYATGTGILTHSAYHYLDLVASLIEESQVDWQPDALKISYLQRLGDYVGSASNRLLRTLCGDDGPEEVSIDDLSETARQSEFGVHLHLPLFESASHITGQVLFCVNNSTYSPRSFPSSPENLNPDNQGMRVAQLFLDLHFGALANVRLSQNDVIGGRTTVQESLRCNPLFTAATGHESMDRELEGSDLKAPSSRDLLKAAILESQGIQTSKHCFLRDTLDLRSHRSTVLLFARTYEAIANFKSEPPQN